MRDGTDNTDQADAHQASISDEQLAEWAAERESLRQAGDPDRPPDVRTGAMRTWRLRSGEPSACLAVQLDETPLAGWTAQHRIGATCTLLASRQPDGRILLRHRVVADGSVRRDDEVWLASEAEIEPTVEPVLAHWATLGFETPDVASADDFAEAMRQVRNLPWAG